MAKLRITFAQALDHLKVGSKVTVGNGDPRPPKQDVIALNRWNGHNYTGKVVELTADRIDVETKRPGAVVVSHYDASYGGYFEVEASQASGAGELERRATIGSMSSEQRFDAIMDEVEKLRAQVVLLESIIEADAL